MGTSGYQNTAVLSQNSCIGGLKNSEDSSFTCMLEMDAGSLHVFPCRFTHGHVPFRGSLVNQILDTEPTCACATKSCDIKQILSS